MEKIEEIDEYQSSSKRKDEKGKAAAISVPL